MLFSWLSLPVQRVSGVFSFLRVAGIGDGFGKSIRYGEGTQRCIDKWVDGLFDRALELRCAKRSLLEVNPAGNSSVNLTKQIFKVLLAVSVVLASLPVGASEVVCVIGPQQTVVPMAKCGMSCCAHGRVAKSMCEAPAHSAPGTPPCCASKHAKVEARQSSSLCFAGGKSCRCETRITSSLVSPVVAVRVASIQTHELPAILPQRIEVPSLAVIRSGSKIFGADSSPPPKNERSPDQPRAPPIG